MRIIKIERFPDDGYTEITYDNGEYVGDVNEQNERHGFGTYYLADGYSYSGDWVHDIQHGEGKIETPEGVSLYGNWENGYLEGRVEAYHADGAVYELQYVHGKCVSEKRVK